MTRNEQDAEDVVQENFLKAYRQLGRFESRAHFGTWLHRIVANAALDLLRGRDDVIDDRIGIVGHCWGGRVAWLGACHLQGLKAAAIFYGGRIRTAMGPGTPPAIDLVGNISCPVIGFFGNEDKFPTPEDVDAYEAALKHAGVPHTFYRYDGAGHAFQSFNSADHYREEQSEDAWEKVLAFLHENLK